MNKKKFCLLAITSLLFAPAIINTATTVFAEGNNTTQEISDEVREKLQWVYDNLTLNTDLDNVVGSFYLPTKSLYDSKISWASSSTRYLDVDGTVNRPAVGKEAVNVTLTATISIGEATMTKIFNCRVLPKEEYNPTVTTSFSEDFSNYKLGQDLSNYLIWEHSGDDIATIKSTVIDNNMVSDKVLDFNPLATLYKDTSYKTKITTTKKSVLEAYVMTTGSISGFRFELLQNTSKKISLGFDYDDDGNNVFKVYNPSIEEDGDKEEVLSTYDNGVWYKLRFEFDLSSKKYNAYYYDWKQNGKLVNITPSGGIKVDADNINYFRMRVLTGRNDGHIFVSNVRIDEYDKLPSDPENNPNKSVGIGEIENFEESYLLVEDQDFELPKFVVHNRFDKNKILNEGTDYTITKSFGENGEVNTSVVGDYVTCYTITLNPVDGVSETKELYQYYHVDPKDATAQLSNLRIAPIVNDSNPDAEKVLKITAKINRQDSYVHYVAVKAGSNPLTNIEVKNKAGSNICFSGKEKINKASFQINVHGLIANQEYDFYVITENDNGLSEVYVKKNISISVYNIEDPEDFFFMCTDPEVQTTSFRLLNDIDFADYYWAASEITRPEYTGTFDGQGYTIKNLKIVAPYKKASLFYDFAGTFKNLTFENCSLTGNESVGFIGGYGFRDAHVENIVMRNCSVNCYDTASAGDGYYGLIFGRCEGGSKGGNVVINNVSIEDCNIDAPKYVGAVAGNIQKITSLTITNIYCKVTMKSDNAALGLLSRIRTGVSSVSIKNAYIDINIVYAKKEVACVAGHLEDTLNIENVVGKLTLQGLTQPTYWNTVVGRYGTSAKITHKNCYFFSVDTSSLSEDTITPVSSALHVGEYLTEPSNFTKEWWERNTCFSDLDTNPTWGYNETTKTPYLRALDLTTLSFSAEEVNYYIDQIGDVIDSEDRYYIKKAYELYAYCSDKNNVKYSTLEQAKKDYESYYSSLTTAIESADSIYSSITGAIEWNYTERSSN